MKRILYILALSLSILACTDEIDKSNRYTFTGETVADYMLNRSEKYSHFVKILRQAKMLTLLSTYGQFTLFLPDNEGVENFLYEQDSIYHTTKETDTPVWTGITSPLIDELSDSMANVIARTHLVEGNYRTAQFVTGTLPRWNFNDRYLSINYKVTDEECYIMLNNHSAIINGDNEVENGIIHIIDKAVPNATNSVPDLICEFAFFSLFSEALKATGFSDSLQRIIDNSYVQEKNVPYIPSEYAHTYQYPEKKFYKYTGFIEPDDVFHSNGINNLADLRAFAEKWYGTEDRDNPKSQRNALYKFVAYHFIPRELPYNKLIISHEKGKMCHYIGYDITDYFETMCHHMMKIVKPLSSEEGKDIFINYSKRSIPYNHEMRKHLNVRVVELTEFVAQKSAYEKFNPMAANGIVHPIDKILIYNEDEMYGNILNERMRFDVFTLLPELSCNDIRYSESFRRVIPNNYCRNIKGESLGGQFFYDSPYWGYFNDQLALRTNFDFALRLPPVPARTYEIRMSHNTHYAGGQNGRKDNMLIQIYLDDKVCGLPIDTRIASSDISIGWIPDEETFDNGVENDRQMRNRGWMKAPDSYLEMTYDAAYLPPRNFDQYVRRIVTRQYMGEGEHWLRVKSLNTSDNTKSRIVVDFSFDYIELVPLHIVSAPTKPEDRH